jgi:hypothetical protein
LKRDDKIVFFFVKDKNVKSGLWEMMKRGGGGRNYRIRASIVNTKNRR